MTPIEALATIDYRLSTIDYEGVTTMEKEKVCPLRQAAITVACATGRVVPRPQARPARGMTRPRSAARC